MKKFICQNCSVEFHAKSRKDRPRKFCSNACCRNNNNEKKKLERKELNCLNCDKPFKVTSGEAKNRKFCCGSCSAEHNNSLRLIGKGSKRKSLGLEKINSYAKRDILAKLAPKGQKPVCEKTCGFCEREFQTKRVSQKFCCNECSLAYRKANKKPPKVHNISCLYCGEKYKSKTSKKSFCSQVCAVKFDDFVEPKHIKSKKCKDCDVMIVSSRTFCDVCFFRAADVRKRVDMTIGELKELFPYPLWRRKASSQGHKTAKLIPNKCAYCDYDKHVEVCHVKPIQDFPDHVMYISEINALENLVKLCPNHHWELDYGELSIMDIINKKSENKSD